MIFHSGNAFHFLNESVNIYYLQVMYKIVIPVKDLLIALSFAYLYYYQGLKNRKETLPSITPSDIIERDTKKLKFSDSKI